MSLLDIIVSNVTPVRYADVDKDINAVENCKCTTLAIYMISQNAQIAPPNGNRKTLKTDVPDSTDGVPIINQNKKQKPKQPQ